jgi:Uri superfamily endonuclease
MYSRGGITVLKLQGQFRVSRHFAEKKNLRDEISYLNSIIYHNYVIYTPACATTEG